MLDLTFSLLSEDAGLHDDWHAWQNSTTGDSCDSPLGNINDRGVLPCALMEKLLALLFWDEAPETINIDRLDIAPVLVLVEDTHAVLTKEARMIEIHHQLVVMLTTSLSTASWVLSVLSNTTITDGVVSSLLPGCSEPGWHDVPFFNPHFVIRDAGSSRGSQASRLLFAVGSWKR